MTAAARASDVTGAVPVMWRRAAEDLGDLPEPLQLDGGQEQASQVLARLRADER